jgi:hypothetical protein
MPITLPERALIRTIPARPPRKRTRLTGHLAKERVELLVDGLHKENVRIRQIVAIAKSRGVKVIYSNDRDVAV